MIGERVRRVRVVAAECTARETIDEGVEIRVVRAVEGVPEHAPSLHTHTLRSEGGDARGSSSPLLRERLERALAHTATR